MIREITDKEEWNNAVRSQGGHPLQLWGWGEVKAKHGWQAVRLELSSDPWVGAQVLIRELPAPFTSFAYIPRGPVGEGSHGYLNELSEYVKQRYRSVALSVEPHSTQWTQVKGWRKARNDVLIARTLILDLSCSDDELLAAMSKKTRQYIRKSNNDGVIVRRANDKDLTRCLDIYDETAKRASFTLHDRSYYEDIFHELGDDSPVYVAEYDQQIVAFLWLAASEKIAFELYGGVSDEGQRLRANYSLKWFAISDMKRRGVTEYDLNGLLNDGISAFKAGFGQQESLLVGTYDKPLSPLYSLWNTGLPVFKKVVRVLRRR